MNPFGLVLGLILAFGGRLQTTASVSDLAAERSRTLYLQAVSAWERKHFPEATRLARLALSSNPTNKQAFKLLEIMGVAVTNVSTVETRTLEPIVAGIPGGWSFEERSGSINSFPEFVHLAVPSEIGPPSYAVMDLAFPSESVQWEVEFRIRFGAPGSLSSGVELVKSQSTLMEMVSDGIRAHVRTSGTTLWTGAAPAGWTTYRFMWREGKLEISLDGRVVGRGDFGGVPDRLVFGSRSTKRGKQTEAFFDLTEYTYHVRGVLVTDGERRSPQ